MRIHAHISAALFNHNASAAPQTLITCAHIRSCSLLALPPLLPSSPSAMAALPAVCELLTVRQGCVHTAGGADATRSLQSCTRTHACLLRVDDQTDATVGVVRQALQTADAGSACPVWLCSNTAAAPLVSSALAAFPAINVAFPLTASGLASANAQTEAQRVATWSSQHRVAASRVVLQLPPTPTLDGEVAALTAECVHALEKLGGAWLVQADAAAARSPPLHARLQSLLAHSSLPVLLVAPLLPFASAALSPATAAPSWTAGALRWLDSLATLPSLHRLHVALARPVSDAVGESSALDLPLLSQHWTAMRKREQFRATNKLQQETASVRSRPSPPSSTNGAAAAVSGVVAPPPVAAAPAQFYRAAFTPTTMFYRLAMSVDESTTRRAGGPRVRAQVLFPARATFSYSFACVCVCSCKLSVCAICSCFSPALPISDLLCYSLLQDGVRSLLGTVGLSKCALQLLHWDADSGTAIVSTRSDMSVGARAAWMLMGNYQQKTCRIDVQQQSLFLAALATQE